MTEPTARRDAAEWPNGYPDSYSTAKSYRWATTQKDVWRHYWDAELETYRHVHEDGTTGPLSICQCDRHD